MLYDKSGLDSVVLNFCHFVASAIHYELKQYRNQTEYDYLRISADGRADTRGPDSYLRTEIGHKYSRKCLPSLSIICVSL